MLKKLTFISLLLLLFVSCEDNKKTQSRRVAESQSQSQTVPDFNADSAYYYVKQQLDFGPRVPAPRTPGNRCPA